MRNYSASYDCYEGIPKLSPSYRFIDFQMGEKATRRQIFAKAKKLVSKRTVAAVWEHDGDLIAKHGEVV